MLPGHIAIWAFRRADSGSTPDFGAWNSVILTVMVAFSVDFLTVFFAKLVGRCPPLGDFLVLAAGRPTYEEAVRIGTHLADGWEAFGATLGASWAGAALVGAVVGKVKNACTAPRRTDQIFVNSKDVWTVLDVLVADGVLYRGIYSSHELPDEKRQGYLALVLPSRLQMLAKDESPTDTFEPIRNFATVDEVAKMILGAFDATTEQGVQEMEVFRRSISEGPVDHVVGEILASNLNRHAQMVLLWRDIRNINVRQFKISPKVLSPIRDAELEKTLIGRPG